MNVFVIVGSTWDYNWVEAVYADAKEAEVECERLLSKHVDDYIVEEHSVR